MERVPLYEYQCKKCKHRFEKIHQSYSDPRVKKCPECGGPVVQLLSAPATHFKGTGWYATDYAKKSSGSEASGSESGGDDSSASKAKEKTETKSSSEKSATADGKSSEASKESKPKAESKKKK
jgi:putative FmdB family regulatory protein